MQQQREELTNEAREAVMQAKRQAAEQHTAIVEQLVAEAPETARQAEVARAIAAGELVDQVGREARGEVEQATAFARRALEETLAQERASMEEQTGQRPWPKLFMENLAAESPSPRRQGQRRAT